MCRHRKKHSVYRIRDDPQFKASSGSLGTYPPQITSHSDVRINTSAARVENHWLLAQKGQVVCPATCKGPDFSSMSSTVLPCPATSIPSCLASRATSREARVARPRRHSPETAVCARSSVHRECSEHWANLAFRKKKRLNEELLDSDPCGALGHVVFFFPTMIFETGEITPEWVWGPPGPTMRWNRARPH